MIIGIKKTWIWVASIAAVLAAFCGMYLYFSPAIRIVPFDEKRDTQFIIDMFKKHWYWLVEGTEFSPEYMLKYRASGMDYSKIGDTTIYMLYEHRNPVGFVAYHLKSAKVGELHFLAVDESYRSKGYGSMLLKYAMHELEKRGVDRITLLTRTNNLPAQVTYIKAGFKETKRINGFVFFEYTVNHYDAFQRGH